MKSSSILRKLIREVIEASSSSSPSTDTEPDSPEKDKDDGGDQTTLQPEPAIERYISNTKNVTDVKQSEEVQKLASTLKADGVDTKDKIMTTLKNLERDEDGGLALADKIIQNQTTAEGRKFGKSRR
jgi:hypothetical protein